MLVVVFFFILKKKMLVVVSELGTGVESIHRRPATQQAAADSASRKKNAAAAPARHGERRQRRCGIAGAGAWPRMVGWRRGSCSAIFFWDGDVPALPAFRNSESSFRRRRRAAETRRDRLKIRSCLANSKLRDGNEYFAFLNIQELE